MNGKPEVSTKVYGTVKTQNIYLADGTYGVMVEANHVTAEDFAAGKKSDTIDPVIYTGAGVTNGTTGADSLNEIGKNIAKMLNGTDVTPTKEAGANVYTVATGTTYAPNTDLATALPDIKAANITWEWGIGADDNANGADTILGNLLASTAGTASKVVYKDTSDYKAITVAADTGLATAGTAANITVASTKTSFDITLTVEQAD